MNKQDILNFFSEESPYSITRVAFIWIIANASFALWFCLIFGTENAVEAGGIFVTLSSVATGLKLYQKGQERKAFESKKKREV